ncbi:MAG TPA: hypothetical protein VH914_21870 [Acidimicrobiia bacterium]|nr:hypothetical protein [Acidimicrobiia bacterium]
MRNGRLALVVAVSAVIAASFVPLVAPTGAGAKTLSPEVPISPNGPAVLFNFNTAGVTKRAAVMAITGEQLTFAVKSGTFADCDLHLTLRAPDHHVLAGPVCAGRTGAVSVANVPADGRYVLTLQAAPSASGQATLAVTSSGGPLSITPNANALPVKWPHGTNENFWFGFRSASDAHYAAVVTGGSINQQCQVTAAFLDSTGNPIGPNKTCIGAGGFLNSIDLPSTGLYFLQLVGFDGKPLQVTLYHPVDVRGTIGTDGAPVPINLETPGQVARFTFSGTAGQQASSLVMDPQFHEQDGYGIESLERPDGTAFGTTGGGFLPGQTLDQTGTWTLVVGESLDRPFSATVSLWQFSTDFGTITPNGSKRSIPMVPGQNANLTFSAPSGQAISVLLSKVRYVNRCDQPTQLFLRAPDDTQVGYAAVKGTVGYMNAVPRTQSGTYKLFIEKIGACTMTSGTLQVFTFDDQTETLPLDGTVVPVDITAPGQRAVFTFEGSPGEKVAVSLTNLTIANKCSNTELLRLVNTGGFAVAHGGGCGTAVTLPATTVSDGTWTVVFDPLRTGTGTADLSATVTSG